MNSKMMKQAIKFVSAGVLVLSLIFFILTAGEASQQNQSDNLDQTIYFPLMHKSVAEAVPEPTLEPTVQPTPQPGSEISGNTFYVSRDGNNSNGRTWATAWNELDQINWEEIQPGDGIVIDGGSSSMTYRTTLRPAASGTDSSPIIVQLSADNGRNGQAIIFGGNSQPLPECGQISWDSGQHDQAGIAGIQLDNGISNVLIDGRKRAGFVIHGWAENGVKFNPDKINNNRDDNPQNISLRYMEIYNNGGVERKNDGSTQNLWYPLHSSAGIKLAGVGHVFSFLEVHDNAADAIQSAYTNPSGGVYNNMDDFTLTDSWLYNQRPHSGTDNSPSGETCTANSRGGCDELGAPNMANDYHDYPSTPANRQESFNWCTHSDGIQIYSSNEFNTMHIERSIIGPNFMTALLLGDRNGSNQSAWVDNLTLKDVVLTRYMHNALGMKNPADHAGKNWDIENMTMYGHFNNMQKGTLNLDSNANYDEHRIANTIMMYGRTNMPNGNVAFSNNCEYGMYSDTIGGQEIDPQFKTLLNRDVFESNLNVDFATVFTDDYTSQNSSCQSAGSGVHSVNDLLARFNRD